MMSAPHICDLCSRPLAPHAHYIVRIEVFADPTVPPIDTNDPAQANDSYESIIEQLKHLSADDAQDQVHRQFFFTVCPQCHPKFLANPLGKPRQREAVEN